MQREKLTMQVITGEIIKTIYGDMLIPENQDLSVFVGEKIIHDGEERIVESIVPPSTPRPNGLFN